MICIGGVPVLKRHLGVAGHTIFYMIHRGVRTVRKTSLPSMGGVGGLLKKMEKKTARAGWQGRLALARATSRAEVDVISAQLCSCTRAIFSTMTLS